MARKWQRHVLLYYTCERAYANAGGGFKLEKMGAQRYKNVSASAPTRPAERILRGHGDVRHAPFDILAHTRLHEFPSGRKQYTVLYHV